MDAGRTGFVIAGFCVPYALQRREADQRLLLVQSRGLWQNNGQLITAVHRSAGAAAAVGAVQRQTNRLSTGAGICLQSRRCGLKSIARPRHRQPQRVWGFPPLRLPDFRPLSRLLETVLSTPATTPCIGFCFFRPVRSRAWAHRAASLASLAPNSRPLTTIPGSRAGVGSVTQRANEPTGRWTDGRESPESKRRRETTGDGAREGAGGREQRGTSGNVCQQGNKLLHRSIIDQKSPHFPHRAFPNNKHNAHAPWDCRRSRSTPAPD